MVKRLDALLTGMLDALTVVGLPLLGLWWSVLDVSHRLVALPLRCSSPGSRRATPYCRRTTGGAGRPERIVGPDPTAAYELDGEPSPLHFAWKYAVFAKLYYGYSSMKNIL